ncbi:MAG TPA: YtxH domain-containing protein [Candidatus Sulfotelmatobacter sp.]|nr:YtxH domain-containing protein [Candidatus Sulfotelmatobacter sp.]
MSSTRMFFLKYKIRLNDTQLRITLVSKGKDGTKMNLNRLLKSILKTAVYIMDSTSDTVDRVSDRASRFADDARDIVYPNQGNTMRNILSFAAGVGVGVAAGILLAPQSGAELRNSIGDRVQDISDKVRGRSENYATGTDMR